MKARFPSRMMALAVACLVAAFAGTALGQGLARTERVDLQLSGPYSLRTEDPRHLTSAVMLREVRAMDLEAGPRTVEWLDFPEAAMGETAQVSLVSAPSGVRVVGVRVFEPQLSPAALAASLRGVSATASVPEDEMRRIRARTSYASAAPNGEQITVGGAIVSTHGGLVLRVGKELTVLPPATVRTESASAPRRLFVDIEVAPGTPRTRVALQLDVLLQKVLVHGPHYVLRADLAAGRAQLSGSVLVSNVSGYALDGAKGFLAPPEAAVLAGRFSRTSDGPTGLAQTWAPSLLVRADTPFPLRAPLTFGPHGIADAPVVAAADLPLSFSSSLGIGSTSSLAEKQTEPLIQVPSTRTFTLDVAAVPELRKGLPAGAAVLLAGGSNSPPAPMGEGFLGYAGTPGKNVVVQASGPTWGPSLVGVAQTSTRRLGKCTVQSSFRYEVQRELLDHGPFEVLVPFPKKTVTATVSRDAQRDGVSVVSDARGTTVTVARRPSPASGADKPYALAVQYKIQDCNL